MEHILHLVEKEDLLNAPYNDLHKLFARFSEFTKDVDYITDVLNFCSTNFIQQLYYIIF